MPDARSATPFCALIVMGVSGSGKSTVAIPLAKRLGWRFREGDDFHPAANIAKMRAGHPLDDDDRWPWLRAIADEIARERQRGNPLVISCSALKRSYRQLLVAGHADVRIVYLKGSRELIGGRLARRRGHFMPPELIDSQFDDLEEPAADEAPIVVDVDAPVEALVDEIIRRLSSAGIIAA